MELVTSDSDTSLMGSNFQNAVVNQNTEYVKLSIKEAINRKTSDEKQAALYFVRPVIDQSLRLFKALPKYLLNYKI